MKRNKLNVFICITCGLAVLGFVLFQMGGADNFLKNISDFHVGWLLAAFLCMLAFWLIESLALHIIVKAVHKEQRFWQSVCVNMGGQYFHSITPFASGGQPFQAYYLNKQGVDLGVAMNCLVAKFIIYQFALVCTSLVLLCLRLSYFRANIDNFTYLIILGFILNLVVMLWAVSLALFQKTTRKLSEWIIRLLAKCKLLKHPEKKIAFMEEELEKFSACFQEMLKDFPTMLLAFVLSVLHLLAFMSVPYMIYRAFGLWEVDFLTIISAQAFVMLASAFVPVPGAGIGAEGAFYLFFNSFFPKDGQVGIAMLLWRFITFYFTVIVGVFFAVKANKKE